MCGIAGYFSPFGVSLGGVREVFAELVAKVQHRGPDGTGILAGRAEGILPADSEGIAQWLLGHTRLAIFDLSAAGQQPMRSADGRFCVSYNGEIYNFLELRDELSSCGHNFKTETDTEVLLAAYAEWGEDCVARFIGMFAFLLVDLQKGEAFLARDRFGIKPLYIWQDETRTVIVSEPKQLGAIPEFRPRANRQMLSDFILEGRIEHTVGECSFAEVAPFPAAHTLRWNISQTPTLTAARRYWNPPRETRVLSWTEAVEQFGATFRDALRLRLRSDVTVGSCLSGGMDSSSIVGVASRELGAKMKTISSCWHNSPADEQTYIDAVNQHCGAESVKVFPSPEELLASLDRLVYHQDEPFGSLSLFAQWRVMETARAAGVTVLLDGQGGDENLCGYLKFTHLYLHELLAQRRFSRSVRHVYGMLRHGDTRLFNFRLGRRYLSRWFPSLRAAGENLLQPEWQAYGRSVWAERMGKAKTLREHQWADLTMWSLPALLRYEDRNSMAHGIEARVPFVDHRLVELSLTLPEEFFFAQGKTKRLLAEAMGDALPEVVQQRRTKLGFETPQADFLRGQVGEYFAGRKNLWERLGQIVKPQLVMEAFTKYRQGDETIPGDLLFRLLSVGLWAERFSVEL